MYSSPASLSSVATSSAPPSSQQHTPPDEETISREFVRIVNEIRRQQASRHGAFSQPITMPNARKFLSARKFDLQRALALYKAHEMIRQREGLIRFDLNSPVLRSELFSGKFTVLPQRDPSTGCCITLFSACKHNPLSSSHQVTLQNIVLQLDVCISRVDAQNNGILFIYNMNNSKYANFDYELSQKILALLKGAYPAKLKKVLIITPPIWFKAPFKILRLFVREKLRDRVYMLNQSQLRKHLPAGCLPTELGGDLPLEHEKWVDHCLEQIRANRLDQSAAPADADAGDPAHSFMFNCDLIGENLGTFGQESEASSTAAGAAGGSADDDDDDFRKAHSEVNLAGLSEQFTGLFDKLNTNLEEDYGSKPGFGEEATEKLIDFADAPADGRVAEAASAAGAGQPLSKAGHVKHKPENIPIRLATDPVEEKPRGDGEPDTNGNGHFKSALNESDAERVFELQVKYLTDNENTLHQVSDPGMHLNEFIQHLNANGRKGLYEEYDQLKKRKNFALVYNNVPHFREFCLRNVPPKEESLSDEISSMLDDSIYPVEKAADPFELTSLSRALPANFVGLYSLFGFKNSLKKENVCKNRYSDVLCYDHSRVKLFPVSDEPIEDSMGYEIIQTDYINANFVDGFDHKNAFISTQGPLNSTCVDFWEMCITNEVKVIVMTTRTMERQRMKCAQYWPLQLNSQLNFAYLTLVNNEMHQFQDYVISRLTLTNNKTGLSYEITHMQFLSWPDYGVPATACAMLEFRQKVRDELSTAMVKCDWPAGKPAPPIVVHCSAGIGRTGTFITLDISILRLDRTGLINIQSTVEKIRSQRAHSIQTQDQYVFCYLALLEYALISNMLENVDLSGFEDSDSELDD